MTTTTRGTCQVCGTVHPVRKDGTLRSHWEVGTSHRCSGSNWPPANSPRVVATRTS